VKKDKKGFTLVEFLIVCAVMGLLVAIVAPQFVLFRQRVIITEKLKDENLTGEQLRILLSLSLDRKLEEKEKRLYIKDKKQYDEWLKKIKDESYKEKSTNPAKYPHKYNPKKEKNNNPHNYVPEKNPSEHKGESPGLIRGEDLKEELPRLDSIPPIN